MKIKTYDEYKLGEPKNKVIAVSDNFIYENAKTLFLKQHLDKDGSSSCDFTITGIKGNTYFTCKKSCQKKVIYDVDNNPVLNIRNKLIFPHISFYMGKDESDIIGSVQSDSKFVELHNKAIDKMEVLNVMNDKFNCSCGIFQGKESENAPMICKIREIMDSNSFITYSDKEYSIEIAAGIDITFIVALAIIFAEMNFSTRSYRIKDTNYQDNYHY
ncbi:hypothetical protein BCR32DRAFT_290161 [Anaeromyces robustus]|uniref:DUF567-domain-containing protein n=1 Tax=Anaeromyces robustus TaxID=1754192 RepID=A0A1Y1XLF5_9FUNG|nr:hypothetical protein BCR32DRAFT_290161 [Anaeromyces robustus]|eukprot:ORX86174.1 hypothetical protein BCR32DRAFT_290161 [Anaeromyces robustus]